MGTLAHLRHIDKSFASGAQALAGLDLTIEDGEFLSLLGPSGCGKSTALRLIAGLASPTAGSLEWVNGKPDIGFVFQDAVLMPWASAFDNVWLPLRLAGRSRTDATRDVEAALESVGLAKFAKAVPRELSGGMRMRVSIARALVQRPKLLLMDEPFAALDEITRLKLNDDLLRLTQELGTTTVFVTHSVFESAYLSSRIAVFSHRPGRIIETISIDAPMTRSEEFRLSAAYGAACQKASAALHRAMGDPA
jgi:NitT/TauT family transport system ATP-binding protein